MANQHRAMAESLTRGTHMHRGNYALWTLGGDASNQARPPWFPTNDVFSRLTTAPAMRDAAMRRESEADWP